MTSPQPPLAPPGIGSSAPRELTADLPLGVDEAVELVEELAGLWGGELERAGSPGRITLPVSAGIRHGLVEGTVAISRLGADGSRIELEVERESYRLHLSAVVVLLIGAAGGLFLILAPLVAGRQAVQLLPPAFIVMLAAWFLVASRMRHRSAADFLDELVEHARRDHERA